MSPLLAPGAKAALTPGPGWAPGSRRSAAIAPGNPGPRGAYCPGNKSNLSSCSTSHYSGFLSPPQNRLRPPHALREGAKTEIGQGDANRTLKQMLEKQIKMEERRLKKMKDEERKYSNEGIHSLFNENKELEREISEIDKKIYSINQAVKKADIEIRRKYSQRGRTVITNGIKEKRYNSGAENAMAYSSDNKTEAITMKNTRILLNKIRDKECLVRQKILDMLLPNYEGFKSQKVLQLEEMEKCLSTICDELKNLDSKEQKTEVENISQSKKNKNVRKETDVEDISEEDKSYFACLKEIRGTLSMTSAQLGTAPFVVMKQQSPSTKLTTMSPSGISPSYLQKPRHPGKRAIGKINENSMKSIQERNSPQPYQLSSALSGARPMFKSPNFPLGNDKFLFSPTVSEDILIYALRQTDEIKNNDITRLERGTYNTVESSLPIQVMNISGIPAQYDLQDGNDRGINKLIEDVDRKLDVLNNFSKILLVVQEQTKINKKLLDRVNSNKLIAYSINSVHREYKKSGIEGLNKFMQSNKPRVLGVANTFSPSSYINKSLFKSPTKSQNALTSTKKTSTTNFIFTKNDSVNLQRETAELISRREQINNYLNNLSKTNENLKRKLKTPKMIRRKGNVAVNAIGLDEKIRELENIDNTIKEVKERIEECEALRENYEEIKLNKKIEQKKIESFQKQKVNDDSLLSSWKENSKGSDDENKSKQIDKTVVIADKNHKTPQESTIKPVIQLSETTSEKSKSQYNGGPSRNLKIELSPDKSGKVTITDLDVSEDRRNNSVIEKDDKSISNISGVSVSKMDKSFNKLLNKTIKRTIKSRNKAIRTAEIADIAEKDIEEHENKMENEKENQIIENDSAMITIDDILDYIKNDTKGRADSSSFSVRKGIHENKDTLNLQVDNKSLHEPNRSKAEEIMKQENFEPSSSSDLLINIENISDISDPDPLITVNIGEKLDKKIQNSEHVYGQDKDIDDIFGQMQEFKEIKTPIKKEVEIINSKRLDIGKIDKIFNEEEKLNVIQSKRTEEDNDLDRKVADIIASNSSSSDIPTSSEITSFSSGSAGENREDSWNIK